MPLTISRAEATGAADWDAFVEHHPEGRFCHLWGFRQALERAYGYRCLYLNIHSNNERIGIFPSIVARRPLRHLVSQPFNEYGGPLTRPLSPHEYAELGEILLSAAREQRCKSIEIRGGVGCDAAEHADFWIRKPLHQYAVLKLDEPDTLWRKTLTHEARKGVNQARKSGLQAEIRRSGRAVEDPFYTLYLSSMKRLGVPPHPRRLFEHLAAALEDRVVSAWVLSDARPVSMLLGLITGKRIQIWITASDDKFWAARPNDLAHWELIRWAALQNLQLFDFGSARYAGQIQFKKKWGVTFHDYSCYLIEQSEARGNTAIPSVDSSGPWMTTLSQIWRATVPLRLTPLLGAPIRRYLTK
jgi:CelD/BcsL family acetyltransferase involved in cellulose biosynthesis